MTAITRVPPDTVERQVVALLAAWGIPEAAAAATGEVLVAADLFGIDSHGVALLPLYERFLGEGIFARDATWRLVRESPVSALVDGGGGLGHGASLDAVDRAVAKARAAGLAAAAVRSSGHFGAAGVYAKRIADAGLVGLAVSNVHVHAIVPTRAREPMFGTNPLAFAAPARRYLPFLLDMATSTVAYGKLRVAAYRGRPVPVGWALDEAGEPTTDPHVGIRTHMLTPLGATPELSSHKGYGLAAMVEILSATLTGASYARDRAADSARGDVGHFFLAIDPTLFREEGAFERDLDAMMDHLRGAEPIDPDFPVLVHGDREYHHLAERRRDGIPLPQGLIDELRAICDRAGIDSLI